MHEDDLLAIKSFGYSDSVDEYYVKQLLLRIFQQEGTFQNNLQVLGIEKTQLELDMKKEVMSTILSYLELHNYLKVLPNVLITCSVQFMNTEPKVLVHQNKLIKWIVDFSKRSNGVFEFDLSQAATQLKTDLDEIQQELFRFQVITTQFVFNQFIGFFHHSMKKEKSDMN